MEEEELPDGWALGAGIPCPPWLHGSYPSGEGAGPCTDLGARASKRPMGSLKRGIFRL